ncbi:MAG: YhcH/YjgK/YiaL family protein [Niabella sp.]
MKKNDLLFACSLFIATTFIMVLIACNNNHMEKVSQWSEKEIEDWYQASPWYNLLPLKPDSSIDKRFFVEQNILNPQSWEAAFRFIKASDFNNMEPGRYELADDGTYATIADYRNKVSSRFEAHRKFIDIQLVSRGKEYVLITSLDPGGGRRQIQPYDEVKDIEFFSKDIYEQRLLTPVNFMILFPANAHQPCLMVDSVGEVRKVVVKIPYIEKNI